MYEIIVLKPTAVFLSFLVSQLSEDDVPDLKLLQTDNTAYVIRKNNSDKDALDEIEKHFTTMFRHEICRWLGPDARNQIENKGLDFLCCFKLERYSHIILMEPSLAQGRHVLQVKPRLTLFHGVHSNVEYEEECTQVMDRIHLSYVTDTALLIVKNFTKLAEIQPFLKQYYKPIFELAMKRVSTQPAQWPALNSFQAFSQYFTIKIHTQLVHLPQ
jgi:hypothetical protein